MSMLLMLLLVAARSGCDGSTLAVGTCLAGEFEKADAELNRYYRSAVGRLRTEERDDVVAQLRRSEKIWIAYRDAECGAVRTWWSPGSISGAEATTCRIRLSRARTMTIWRDWLTYADSTPPILPRPGGGD